MAAAWLTALIHDDQGNTDALPADFERIVTLDPETGPIEEARAWLDVLKIDLEELRKG